MSEINLLGDPKGIVNLDAEIAYCTLEFGVTQQELNRSEVACRLRTVSYIRTSSLKSGKSLRFRSSICSDDNNLVKNPILGHNL